MKAYPRWQGLHHVFCGKGAVLLTLTLLTLVLLQGAAAQVACFEDAMASTEPLVFMNMEQANNDTRVAPNSGSSTSLSTAVWDGDAFVLSLEGGSHGAGLLAQGDTSSTSLTPQVNLTNVNMPPGSDFSYGIWIRDADTSTRSVTSSAELPFVWEASAGADVVTWIRLDGGTVVMEQSPPTLTQTLGFVPAAASDGWHWWLLESTAGETRLYVDNEIVGSVAQAFGYTLTAVSGNGVGTAVDNVAVWSHHLTHVERTNLVARCSTSSVSATALADFETMSAQDVVDAFAAVFLRSQVDAERETALLNQAYTAMPSLQGPLSYNAYAHMSHEVLVFNRHEEVGSSTVVAAWDDVRQVSPSYRGTLKYSVPPVPPRVESLDSTPFFTIIWVGLGEDDDWSNPSNWEDVGTRAARLPTNVDSASIDGPDAPIQVNVVGDAVVGSLFAPATGLLLHPGAHLDMGSVGTYAPSFVEHVVVNGASITSGATLGVGHVNVTQDGATFVVASDARVDSRDGLLVADDVSLLSITGGVWVSSEGTLRLGSGNVQLSDCSLCNVWQHTDSIVITGRVYNGAGCTWTMAEHIVSPFEAGDVAAEPLWENRGTVVFLGAQRAIDFAVTVFSGNLAAFRVPGPDLTFQGSLFVGSGVTFEAENAGGTTLAFAGPSVAWNQAWRGIGFDVLYVATTGGEAVNMVDTNTFDSFSTLRLAAGVHMGFQLIQGPGNRRTRLEIPSGASIEVRSAFEAGGITSAGNITLNAVTAFECVLESNFGFQITDGLIRKIGPADVRLEVPGGTTLNTDVEVLEGTLLFTRSFTAAADRTYTLVLSRPTVSSVLRVLPSTELAGAHLVINVLPFTATELECNQVRDTFLVLPTEADDSLNAVAQPFASLTLVDAHSNYQPQGSALDFTLLSTESSIVLRASFLTFPTPTSELVSTLDGTFSWDDPSIWQTSLVPIETDAVLLNVSTALIDLAVDVTVDSIVSPLLTGSGLLVSGGSNVLTHNATCVGEFASIDLANGDVVFLRDTTIGAFAVSGGTLWVGPKASTPLDVGNETVTVTALEAGAQLGPNDVIFGGLGTFVFARTFVMSATSESKGLVFNCHAVFSAGCSISHDDSVSQAESLPIAVGPNVDIAVHNTTTIVGSGFVVQQGQGSHIALQAGTSLLLADVNVVGASNASITLAPGAQLQLATADVSLVSVTTPIVLQPTASIRYASEDGEIEVSNVTVLSSAEPALIGAVPGSSLAVTLAAGEAAALQNPYYVRIPEYAAFALDASNGTWDLLAVETDAVCTLEGTLPQRPDLDTSAMALGVSGMLRLDTPSLNVSSITQWSGGTTAVLQGVGGTLAQPRRLTTSTFAFAPPLASTTVHVQAMHLHVLQSMFWKGYLLLNAEARLTLAGGSPLPMLPTAAAGEPSITTRGGDFTQGVSMDCNHVAVARGGWVVCAHTGDADDVEVRIAVLGEQGLEHEGAPVLEFSLGPVALSQSPSDYPVKVAAWSRGTDTLAVVVSRVDGREGAGAVWSMVVARGADGRSYSLVQGPTELTVQGAIPGAGSVLSCGTALAITERHAMVGCPEGAAVLVYNVNPQSLAVSSAPSAVWTSETLGFGVSLAAYGSLAAVGDPGFDAGSGRVVPYLWDGASWLAQDPLRFTGSDTAFGYGLTLQLMEDTLNVGVAGLNAGNLWRWDWGQKVWALAATFDVQLDPLGAAILGGWYMVRPGVLADINVANGPRWAQASCSSFVYGTMDADFAPNAETEVYGHPEVAFAVIHASTSQFLVERLQPLDYSIAPGTPTVFANATEGSVWATEAGAAIGASVATTVDSARCAPCADAFFMDPRLEMNGGTVYACFTGPELGASVEEASLTLRRGAWMGPGSVIQAWARAHMVSERAQDTVARTVLRTNGVLTLAHGAAVYGFDVVDFGVDTVLASPVLQSFVDVLSVRSGATLTLGGLWTLGVTHLELEPGSEVRASTHALGPASVTVSAGDAAPAPAVLLQSAIRVDVADVTAAANVTVRVEGERGIRLTAARGSSSVRVQAVHVDLSCPGFDAVVQSNVTWIHDEADVVATVTGTADSVLVDVGHTLTLAPRHEALVSLPLRVEENATLALDANGASVHSIVNADGGVSIAAGGTLRVVGGVNVTLASIDVDPASVQGVAPKLEVVLDNGDFGTLIVPGGAELQHASFVAKWLSGDPTLGIGCATNRTWTLLRTADDSPLGSAPSHIDVLQGFYDLLIWTTPYSATLIQEPNAIRVLVRRKDCGAFTMFWTGLQSNAWEDTNNWVDRDGVIRLPGPDDLVAIPGEGVAFRRDGVPQLPPGWWQRATARDRGSGAEPRDAFPADITLDSSVTVSGIVCVPRIVFGAGSSMVVTDTGVSLPALERVGPVFLDVAMDDASSVLQLDEVAHVEVLTMSGGTIAGTGALAVDQLMVSVAANSVTLSVTVLNVTTAVVDYSDSGQSLFLSSMNVHVLGEWQASEGVAPTGLQPDVSDLTVVHVHSGAVFTMGFGSGGGTLGAGTLDVNSGGEARLRQMVHNTDAQSPLILEPVTIDGRLTVVTPAPPGGELGSPFVVQHNGHTGGGVLALEAGSLLHEVTLSWEANPLPSTPAEWSIEGWWGLAISVPGDTYTLDAEVMDKVRAMVTVLNGVDVTVTGTSTSFLTTGLFVDTARLTVLDAQLLLYRLEVNNDVRLECVAAVCSIGPRTIMQTEGPTELTLQGSPFLGAELGVYEWIGGWVQVTVPASAVLHMHDLASAATLDVAGVLTNDVTLLHPSSDASRLVLPLGTALSEQGLQSALDASEESNVPLCGESRFGRVWDVSVPLDPLSGGFPAPLGATMYVGASSVQAPLFTLNSASTAAVAALADTMVTVNADLRQATLWERTLGTDDYAAAQVVEGVGDVVDASLVDVDDGAPMEVIAFASNDAALRTITVLRRTVGTSTWNRTDVTVPTAVSALSSIAVDSASGRIFVGEPGAPPPQADAVPSTVCNTDVVPSLPDSCGNVGFVYVPSFHWATVRTVSLNITSGSIPYTYGGVRLSHANLEAWVHRRGSCGSHSGVMGLQNVRWTDSAVPSSNLGHAHCWVDPGPDHTVADVDVYPDEGLWKFHGSHASGTWTLDVCSESAGELGGWCVDVEFEDTTLAMGLTAYWPLDGNGVDVATPTTLPGGASVADDVAVPEGSGGSYSSVDAVAGSAWVTTGDAGTALRIAHSPDIAGRQRMSVSVWLRANATGSTWQTALSKGEQGHYRLHRWLASDRVSWNGGGQPKDARSASRLLDGEWHHVVGLVDLNGTSTLWYDGQEGESIPGSTAFDVGADLLLGASPDAPGREWVGALDEVAVWNRLLVPGEIRSLYAMGRKGVSLGDGVGLLDAGLPAVGATHVYDLASTAWSVLPLPDSATPGARFGANIATTDHEPRAFPSVAIAAPGRTYDPASQGLQYSAYDGGVVTVRDPFALDEIFNITQGLANANRDIDALVDTYYELEFDVEVGDDGSGALVQDNLHVITRISGGLDRFQNLYLTRPDIDGSPYVDLVGGLNSECTGCGSCRDYDVTWTDNATFGLRSDDAPCSGFFTPKLRGPLTPSEPLSGFNGLPVAGVWRLAVYSSGGALTVNDFCIALDGGVAPLACASSASDTSDWGHFGRSLALVGTPSMRAPADAHLVLGAWESVQLWNAQGLQGGLWADANQHVLKRGYPTCTPPSQSDISYNRAYTVPPASPEGTGFGTFVAARGQSLWASYGATVVEALWSSTGVAAPHASLVHAANVTYLASGPRSGLVATRDGAHVYASLTQVWVGLFGPACDPYTHSWTGFVSDRWEEPANWVVPAAATAGFPDSASALVLIPAADVDAVAASSGLAMHATMEGSVDVQDMNVAGILVVGTCGGQFRVRGPQSLGESTLGNVVLHGLNGGTGNFVIHSDINIDNLEVRSEVAADNPLDIFISLDIGDARVTPLTVNAVVRRDSATLELDGDGEIHFNDYTVDGDAVSGGGKPVSTLSLEGGVSLVMGTTLVRDAELRLSRSCATLSFEGDIMVEGGTYDVYLYSFCRSPAELSLMASAMVTSTASFTGEISWFTDLNMLEASSLVADADCVVSLDPPTSFTMDPTAMLLGLSDTSELQVGVSVEASYTYASGQPTGFGRLHLAPSNYGFIYDASPVPTELLAMNGLLAVQIDVPVSISTPFTLGELFGGSSWTLAQLNTSSATVLQTDESVVTLQGSTVSGTTATVTLDMTDSHLTYDDLVQLQNEIRVRENNTITAGVDLRLVDGGFESDFQDDYGRGANSSRSSGRRARSHRGNQLHPQRSTRGSPPSSHGDAHLEPTSPLGASRIESHSMHDRDGRRRVRRRAGSRSERRRRLQRQPHRRSWADESAPDIQAVSASEPFSFLVKYGDVGMGHLTLSTPNNISLQHVLVGVEVTAAQFESPSAGLGAPVSYRVVTLEGGGTFTDTGSIGTDFVDEALGSSQVVATADGIDVVLEPDYGVALALDDFGKLRAFVLQGNATHGVDTSQLTLYDGFQFDSSAVCGGLDVVGGQLVTLCVDEPDIDVSCDTGAHAVKGHVDAADWFQPEPVVPITLRPRATFDHIRVYWDDTVPVFPPVQVTPNVRLGQDPWSPIVASGEPVVVSEANSVLDVYLAQSLGSPLCGNAPDGDTYTLTLDNVRGLAGFSSLDDIAPLTGHRIFDVDVVFFDGYPVIVWIEDNDSFTTMTLRTMRAKNAWGDDWERPVTGPVWSISDTPKFSAHSVSDPSSGVSTLVVVMVHQLDELSAQMDVARLRSNNVQWTEEVTYNITAQESIGDPGVVLTPDGTLVVVVRDTSTILGFVANNAHVDDGPLAWSDISSRVASVHTFTYFDELDVVMAYENMGEARMVVATMAGDLQPIFLRFSYLTSGAVMGESAVAKVDAVCTAAPCRVTLAAGATVVPAPGSTNVFATLVWIGDFRDGDADLPEGVYQVAESGSAKLVRPLDSPVLAGMLHTATSTWMVNGDIGKQWTYCDVRSSQVQCTLHYSASHPWSRNVTLPWSADTAATTARIASTSVDDTSFDGPAGFAVVSDEEKVWVSPIAPQALRVRRQTSDTTDGCNDGVGATRAYVSAYASPNGAAAAPGTSDNPCSLTDAVAWVNDQVAAHPDATWPATVILAQGAYAVTETLAMKGRTRMLGQGACSNTTLVCDPSFRTTSDVALSLSGTHIFLSGFGIEDCGVAVAVTADVTAAPRVSLTHVAFKNVLFGVVASGLRGSLDPSAEISVTMCSFEDVSGDTDGSAMRVQGGHLTVEGCVMRRCSSTGRGGAVFATAMGSVTIVTCTAEDITSEGSGGFAYVDTLSLRMAGVSVLRATAVSGDGGAVYVSRATTYGYVDRYAMDRVAIVDASAAGGSGGGIAVHGTVLQLHMRRTSCHSCVALNGGALALLDAGQEDPGYGESFSMRVYNCTASGGSDATTGGGAIYSSGWVSYHDDFVSARVFAEAPSCGPVALMDSIQFTELSLYSPASTVALNDLSCVSSVFPSLNDVSLDNCGGCEHGTAHLDPEEPFLDQGLHDDGLFHDGYAYYDVDSWSEAALCQAVERPGDATNILSVALAQTAPVTATCPAWYDLQWRIRAGEDNVVRMASQPYTHSQVFGWEDPSRHPVAYDPWSHALWTVDAGRILSWDFGSAVEEAQVVGGPRSCDLSAYDEGGTMDGPGVPVTDGVSWTAREAFSHVQVAVMAAQPGAWSLTWRLEALDAGAVQGSETVENVVVLDAGQASPTTLALSSAVPGACATEPGVSMRLIVPPDGVTQTAFETPFADAASCSVGSSDTASFTVGRYQGGVHRGYLVVDPNHFAASVNSVYIRIPLGETSGGIDGTLRVSVANGVDAARLLETPDASITGLLTDLFAYWPMSNTDVFQDATFPLFSTEDYSVTQVEGGPYHTSASPVGTSAMHRHGVVTQGATLTVAPGTFPDHMTFNMWVLGDTWDLVPEDGSKDLACVGASCAEWGITFSRFTDYGVVEAHVGDSNTVSATLPSLAANGRGPFMVTFSVGVGSVSLYINGTLAQEDLEGFNLFTPSGDFMLPSPSAAGAHVFVALDEVVWWDRTLSAVEVETLWQQQGVLGRTFGAIIMPLYHLGAPLEPASSDSTTESTEGLLVAEPLALIDLAGVQDFVTFNVSLGSSSILLNRFYAGLNANYRADMTHDYSVPVLDPIVLALQHVEAEAGSTDVYLFHNVNPTTDIVALSALTVPQSSPGEQLAGDVLGGPESETVEYSFSKAETQLQVPVPLAATMHCKLQSWEYPSTPGADLLIGAYGLRRWSATFFSAVSSLLQSYWKFDAGQVLADTASTHGSSSQEDNALAVRNQAPAHQASQGPNGVGSAVHFAADARNEVGFEVAGDADVNLGSRSHERTFIMWLRMDNGWSLGADGVFDLPDPQSGYAVSRSGSDLVLRYRTHTGTLAGFGDIVSDGEWHLLSFRLQSSRSQLVFKVGLDDFGVVPVQQFSVPSLSLVSTLDTANSGELRASLSNIDYPEGFTVEFWIFMPVMPRGSLILFSMTDVVSIRLLATGDLAATFGGVQLVTPVNSGPFVSAETWHHVALTRNGDVASVMVDAVVLWSANVGFGSVTPSAQPVDVVLGQDPGPVFAEFRLWRSSFLDTDIDHQRYALPSDFWTDVSDSTSYPTVMQLYLSGATVLHVSADHDFTWVVQPGNPGFSSGPDLGKSQAASFHVGRGESDQGLGDTALAEMAQWGYALEDSYVQDIYWRRMGVAPHTLEDMLLSDTFASDEANPLAQATVAYDAASMDLAFTPAGLLELQAAWTARAPLVVSVYSAAMAQDEVMAMVTECSLEVQEWNISSLATPELGTTEAGAAATSAPECELPWLPMVDTSAGTLAPKAWRQSLASRPAGGEPYCGAWQSMVVSYATGSMYVASRNASTDACWMGVVNRATGAVEQWGRIVAAHNATVSGSVDVAAGMAVPCHSAALTAPKSAASSFLFDAFVGASPSSDASLERGRVHNWGVAWSGTAWEATLVSVGPTSPFLTDVFDLVERVWYGFALTDRGVIDYASEVDVGV